jgi:hypothetical protein
MTKVRKRADDGLWNRSVKRPSRRSQAMTGGSLEPGSVLAGDAEDIVSKSAPPWMVVEQLFQRGRLPLCYSVLTRHMSAAAADCSALLDVLDASLRCCCP